MSSVALVSKKLVCVLRAVEQSGERMAVLTTLVGLLQLKHLQIEGEDGTGSLESDIQLMEVLAPLLLLCQSNMLIVYRKYGKGMPQSNVLLACCIYVWEVTCSNIVAAFAYHAFNPSGIAVQYVFV